MKGITGNNPAPVVPAAQPFDPVFAAQQAAAQFQVGLAGNEAAYQTGQTAYNTGYDASGALNTANPYSQAQLLQDAYHRSQSGTLNAAGNHLYSGSHENAVARDDRNYAQSSDALRRQAQDRYHQIGYGQLSSYAQNASGVNAGGFDALNRAVYGG